MKNSEFAPAYKRAQYVNVKTDEWFNVCGWWWLNLTLAQCAKMYELMLNQGNRENEDQRGKYIELRNGMRLYKPNVARLNP